MIRNYKVRHKYIYSMYVYITNVHFSYRNWVTQTYGNSWKQVGEIVFKKDVQKLIK